MRTCQGQVSCLPLIFHLKRTHLMAKNNLRFFEINPHYIDYLSLFAPHLFANKKPDQHHARKYIGIVLQINDLFYFAPLSSAKPKHRHMQEGLDFIKVKQYSVINLNNMLPVPLSDCIPIDFSKERDPKYRNLLMAEYRFIKMIEEKVQKNARLLYNHKIRYGNSTPLAKRCNDFLLLEQKCREYEQSNLPTNPSLSGTLHSPKSTLE